MHLQCRTEFMAGTLQLPVRAYVSIDLRCYIVMTGPEPRRCCSVLQQSVHHYLCSSSQRLHG